MTWLSGQTTIWRRASCEFILTEAIPILLLILRQAFIHEHQATEAFVHWSLSTVMVFGDTALAAATTLGGVHWYGLTLRGDTRLLPKALTHPLLWLPLTIVTVPLAYLTLVQADPFADQLALKPHAWVFQYAHVLFGAYISARLMTSVLRTVWITGVRLHRYHRYGRQAACYTPIPTGSIVCLMVIIGLVVYYCAIFWSHPHDISLTTKWLG